MTKALKEQLYLAISISFHNQIYDELEAFMKLRTVNDDEKYEKDLHKVKSCTPSHFGVRTKFLLNNESSPEGKEVEVVKKPSQSNNDGEPGSFEFSHILDNISLASHLDATERKVEGLHLSGSAQFFRGDEDDELEFVNSVQIYYDDDYRLYTYFSDGSSNEILFGEKFLFDENEMSMSWKHKDTRNKIVFEEDDEFKEFMTQFRFSSSTDALSESMFTKPEIMSEYEEFSNQLKSSLNPVITKSFSGPRRVLSVRNNTLKRSVKSRPSTSSLDIGSINYDDFQNDNYRPAYAILRSLPKRRSPREKVECILRVLNKTIECIELFWKKYGKTVIVGADDLVPIFTYIVAKGAVPNMHYEMSYIIEFSNESCVRGKYGYALATLQMAVDNLNVVENASKDIETTGEKGNTQVKQLMNAVDTFNSKVNKKQSDTGLDDDRQSSNEDSKRKTTDRYSVNAKTEETLENRVTDRQDDLLNNWMAIDHSETAFSISLADNSHMEDYMVGDGSESVEEKHQQDTESDLSMKSTDGSISRNISMESMDEKQSVDEKEASSVTESLDDKESLSRTVSVESMTEKEQMSRSESRDVLDECNIEKSPKDPHEDADNEVITENPLEQNTETVQPTESDNNPKINTPVDDSVDSVDSTDINRHSKELFDENFHDVVNLFKSSSVDSS